MYMYLFYQVTINGDERDSIIITNRILHTCWKLLAKVLHGDAQSADSRCQTDVHGHGSARNPHRPMQHQHAHATTSDSDRTSPEHLTIMLNARSLRLGSDRNPGPCLNTTTQTDRSDPHEA